PVGRRLLESRADVEKRHDGAAQRKNADGVRGGVGHARGPMRVGDLDDVLEIDGVALRAEDEGQQLDFVDGCRSNCLFSETARAGSLQKFLELLIGIWRSRS